MVANAWKQVLGGGAALAALFVVVPAASGGRLGWGLIFLAAAALSYHGWVANGAQPPTDWYIWMAALTSWGLGDLVTALGEGSTPAWVSVAFFALGYLLFALGIIWFQQTRVVGVDRDWMIDATIVSTAVGVVLWTTLDITSLAASTLTPVEQSMYALAALVHTSFLAFSVRLLILTRGRLIKNWLGGSAALLGTAGSMAHFVLRVQGSDPSPAGVLALWALAAVVFCSMPNEVTHGKYKREGLTDQGRPFARFAVLASAMMGGTLAIVLQDGINGQRTIPVGGSLLLTFLVLGRLLGLVMARERGKRELEARAAQQGMVADLGQQSLSKADLPTLLGQTVQGIAATLRVDHCGVLELLPGGAVLLLREAFGWPDDAVGSAVISADDRRLSFAAVETGQTVVVADMATDDRLDSPELVGGLAATSVVFTPIGGSEAPYGVLIVACDEQRSFTDQEIKFLQAAVNVLAVAIERRAREDEIRHRALHDPLTGLPNRALMIDRLTHALAVRTRRAGELAVLFIDLDHFKDVNDRLGHAAGDELLLGVTKRLQETARSEDTISRFAGDEFVIVCERLEGEHDVIGIAERIISALGRPFMIQGQQANVSASVGIALATDEHDSERLLRDADAAMYRAKERGRACFEVFDEVMGARVMRRLRMEQDLYGAPERKELKVVYQPIIALEREEIVGVEALLRWNHPRDGWVSPGDFIPIAEESGLILILGEWVLHQSCRQLARWSREFPDVRPFRVFVNLSARQLMDPNLIEMVLRSLEETGADPTCLGLEITESAAMEDAETASRNLQALKDLGIHLAMDDFGTGYSSLAHLKRFPVDVVKIDASFIDGLGAGAEDEAIVSAIVGMARALDREVLAEGVETQQQAAAVRELGCDFAQGYLFARPIPPVQVDEMLAAGSLLQRPQMA